MSSVVALCTPWLSPYLAFTGGTALRGRPANAEGTTKPSHQRLGD